MEATVLNIELTIIFLLFIIALVTWIGNQIPAPYTVGLVLAGLVLTFVPALDFEIPELLSELILALFLPPIVFEAAYQLDTTELRNNAGLLAMLTTVGVLVSTLIVAVIVNLFFPGMGLLVAAVFGALISAIDPVAVIALFKESHVEKRLETLVEGESLLNDGTAIVIFTIILAAAMAGGEFSIWDGIVDFLRFAIGGLLIGTVIGYVVARILYYIDDVVVEMTLTTCLAFGSFLIAEQFQVSGVLAVLMAGLMHGRMGFSNMSERTQQTVINVWDYLAYVANAFIFLLIGLTSDIADLLSHLPLIVAAIVAVMISRAIMVYIVAALQVRIIPKQPDLPLSWQHVLFWGGQRGAVSLALALSLPHSLANRESIIIMTFGVVLFTSLVQATTMPWLLARLGLTDKHRPDKFELPQEPI
jgi:Na+:H+ antiporter